MSVLEVCGHWKIIIRILHFICYSKNILRSLLGESSSKVYCWSSAVTRVIRGVSLSSSSSSVLAFKLSVQCSNSFYHALAIQHQMFYAFSATRFYMQYVHSCMYPCLCWYDDMTGYGEGTPFVWASAMVIFGWFWSFFVYISKKRPK